MSILPEYFQRYIRSRPLQQVSYFQQMASNCCLDASSHWYAASALRLRMYFVSTYLSDRRKVFGMSMLSCIYSEWLWTSSRCSPRKMIRRQTSFMTCLRYFLSLSFSSEVSRDYVWVFCSNSSTTSHWSQRTFLPWSFSFSYLLRTSVWASLHPWSWVVFSSSRVWDTTTRTVRTTRRNLLPPPPLRQWSKYQWHLLQKQMWTSHKESILVLLLSIII